MRLAVIGTGYVGLVSGVCFSEFGFHVACVDKNAAKINGLNQGHMPIFEVGLEPMVANNVKAGRLSFTTYLAEAVAAADVVLIAVGTPSNGHDGLPDLRQLYSAAREVARAMQGYTLVVIKSTVSLGTNRRVAEIISETNPEADFDVASNPEFLREGLAIEDFMSPDRIVAGVESKRAREWMTKLYEPVCLNGAHMFFTTFESAEMVKYAANSLLATRIAFINEISDLCEKFGANIRDVAHGIGMDHRIGDKFLRPGPGYGGSCFPKDTLALQEMARQADSPVTIVEAAIASNEARKSRMVNKILTAAGGSLQGKTIATLGVTFKPGTDDMRESASLVILPTLQQHGATIRAYDPRGMHEAERLLPGITWCQDAYSTMEQADMLLILTEWNEFRSLELSKVKALLKDPLVVDLRNIYKRQDMRQHGFHYVCVGRQTVLPGEVSADTKGEDELAA